MRSGIFTCHPRDQCLKEERPKSKSEQILISAHVHECEVQESRLSSIIQLASLEDASLCSGTGRRSLFDILFTILMFESKWNLSLKHNCAVGWKRSRLYVLVFYNSL
jgi:hypothetical protein